MFWNSIMHQNCKGDEQDPVPDPKRAWKIRGKGARDTGDHLTLKTAEKYLIGQNSLIQTYGNFRLSTSCQPGSSTIVRSASS
jgi:hypothetical protein